MSDYKQGRWWRVSYEENGREVVWCETSVKQEALDSFETCPGPPVLWNLHVLHDEQWRAMPS